VINVACLIIILLNTTQKYVVSNAILAAKPLLNLRRSQEQFDLISLQVWFHTGSTALRQLEEKLSGYLQRHSAAFFPKFEIEYRELENTNRLVLRIWIQHRTNFQNMRRYRERRSRIILFLKRTCEELDIAYQLPPQEIVGKGISNGTSDFQNVNLFAEPSPVASMLHVQAHQK
jgi:hypothetical protein